MTADRVPEYGLDVLVTLPLKQIELHPDIARRVSQQPDLLPSRFPNTDLSEDAYIHVFRSHPIQVIPQSSDTTKDGDSVSAERTVAKKRGAIPKLGTFYCIGGLRTFQLAKTRLSMDTEVPVLQVRDSLNPAAYAWLDLLLGAIMCGIHGTGSTQQLGRLWDALPKATRKEIFPALTSRTALTQALGLKEKALLGKRSRNASLEDSDLG